MTPDAKSPKNALKVKTLEKCQYCSAEFPNKTKYRDHVSKHEVSNGFKCLLCHKVFNNAAALNLHHTIQHEGETNTKPKTCAFCHKQFTKAKALALHVTQEHPLEDEDLVISSISCEECNSEFSNVNSLNSHQVDCLHEVRCFPCRKCDTFWNSAVTLKLHYSELHGENIEVCGICGNILSNSQALDAHFNQWHLGTEKYVCDFCDKVFYNRGALDNHTFKVHKIQTSFNCELCSYACSRKNELESHIQAMHGHIDRFYCDICQFSSFKKNKLDLHKRKSHRYTCAHCDMNFESAKDKYTHEKDHNLKRSSKRKRM